MYFIIIALCENISKSFCSLRSGFHTTIYYLKYITQYIILNIYYNILSFFQLTNCITSAFTNSGRIHKFFGNTIFSRGFQSTSPKGHNRELWRIIFNYKHVWMAWVEVIYNGIIRYLSTHFSPLSHFYTPWKHQKTYGFLTFSGCTEM